MLAQCLGTGLFGCEAVEQLDDLLLGQLGRHLLLRGVRFRRSILFPGLLLVAFLVALLVAFLRALLALLGVRLLLLALLRVGLLRVRLLLIL